MPLLKGDPYPRSVSLPPGLKRSHEVWVIKITGEVFIDYELTGQSGLTYIQAAVSENVNKTSEGSRLQKEPERFSNGLQMSLKSPALLPPVDPEIYLIANFLRSRARSLLASLPTENLEEAFTIGTWSDSKRRSSSKKSSFSVRSKADAKEIPGTVKHTIYETLKWVGPNGATISFLHQRLKDCRIQTTWADSSARNCIASLLHHDKAFIKLPKHGHYALSSLIPQEDKSAETEKRDLAVDVEVSDFARNNSRCFKCSKTKDSQNSPLVFCDQCPSAIHLSCAQEQEQALREIGQNPDTQLDFPYVCFRCIQKKLNAEKQKVVRQKRDKNRQRRQEEMSHLSDDEGFRSRSARTSARRFPIEDSELTVDDHGQKEELIAGPLLPEIGGDSAVIMDCIQICEFFLAFGSELDERLVVADLTVAELMYSLCYPFDSPIVKNSYQALLKSAVHQVMRMQDGPSEARTWNSALDGYSWPEILKSFLRFQQENEILEDIEHCFREEAGAGLFLELSARLHLQLLSLLVSYVASSLSFRTISDNRVVEAKKIEASITRISREMTKAKNSKKTCGQPTEEKDSHENGFRRNLRQRGGPEQFRENLVQNELAILEEKLDRCKVRVDPLGYDRHRNSYYWFPTLSEAICVISPDHTELRCVRSKEGLDRILNGLNPKGVREKHLAAVLKDEHTNLVSCLVNQDFPFDLQKIERGQQSAELLPFFQAYKKQSKTPIDRLKQEYISSGIRTMVNRLHKIIGGVASVSSEVQSEIKTFRMKINSLDSTSDTVEFLRELSQVLKKVFQDGTERNGKTQMKLSVQLEALDQTESMTLSELGLFIASLRDIVEPLVRNKSKSMQASMESKRKRGEKSNSDKSSSSNEIAAPSKKLKQKHNTSSDDTDNAEILKFVEVPWRVTRSYARQNEDSSSAAESSEESQTESSSESREENDSDEDYEVENGGHEEEQESSNDETMCIVCRYGGRLVHCKGEECIVGIHRACMIKTSDEFYCPKCARAKRAQCRNGRHF